MKTATDTQCGVYSPGKEKDTYTCSIYYYFNHWSKTFHFNTKVFQLKHKTVDPLHTTAMS